MSYCHDKYALNNIANNCRNKNQINMQIRAINIFVLDTLIKEDTSIIYCAFTRYIDEMKSILYTFLKIVRTCR